MARLPLSVFRGWLIYHWGGSATPNHPQVLEVVQLVEFDFLFFLSFSLFYFLLIAFFFVVEFFFNFNGVCKFSF
jgi:hypothetical protein